MSKPLILALAAALAVTAAGSAFAREAPVERHVSVVTSDLDLTTEAGADALLARLARAAKRACGGEPSYEVDQIRKARAYDACRARALTAAVAAVDAPLLARRLAETRQAAAVRTARR